MPIQKNLMGVGTAARLAAHIVGSVDNGTAFTGQTATGTNLATSYQLGSEITWFSTVASGAGANLPLAMNPGDSVEVYNSGVNALLIYPQNASGIINELSAGAGFSVAANKGAKFIMLSATQFFSNLTA